MAMRRAGLALLAVLAGCTPSAPPDVATLRPGSFGGALAGDARLVNVAAEAWRDPAALSGRPRDGARAVAAIELLAGDLAMEPRWAALPVTIRADMTQARIDLRASLGITPGAASQAVMDSLARADAALSAGDAASARAALTRPFYTLGPDATLRQLGALPQVLSAGIAATEVQDALARPEAN